jgi:hypothetical protein
MGRESIVGPEITLSCPESKMTFTSHQRAGFRHISTVAAGLLAAVLLTLVSIVPAGARQAVEIEPGTQYQGVTALQAPEYGISFTLPAGWAGMLPPDAEFFVMQHPSLQAYVLAGLEELTLSQAQQLMGQDIDLGDGIVLQPAGEMTTEGVTIKADYDVTGAPQPLQGQVTAIIGDHGYSLYFIVAAAPADFEAAKAEVERMSASVSLGPPVAAPVPAPGSWQEQLAGRKLSHFYTTSGYTEEDYIWLCADGRFFRSANSGGFGGGASGAFESSYGGRWQATGNAASGTLTLSYNDGSTGAYTLTIEDQKLFLDGGRYFREAYDCR